MRLGRLAVLVLLLAVPLSAAQLPAVSSPCTPLVALVGNAYCAPIHPGGRVYTPLGQCSFNFVVTDGEELYIGTAGHCIRLGERARLSADDFIGTTVQRAYGGGKDWAFIRIDPEDRPRVDASMGTWGGPNGGDAREPEIGETVFQHGWGASLGQSGFTRGRAGVVVAPTVYGFIYAGSVDSGDSGSPVMLASGEAAGIAVATIILPPHVPVPVTWATRFDYAIDDLEAVLGKPVSVVEGRPLLTT